MNSDEIPYPPRPLERLFNSSHARVIDFLIMNQTFDYSHSDIANLSGVSVRTLDKIMTILAHEKLIVKTRKSGKCNMYKFNSNSEKGKTLEHYFKLAIQQDNEIVKDHIGEESEKIISSQNSLLANSVDN